MNERKPCGLHVYRCHSLPRTLTLVNMPVYEVYVTCDQCGQPHSVHIKLTLDDETLDGTRLAAHFDGRPLPSEIVFMQTNNYRCPHTKQLFPAADIDNAILFLTRQSA